MPDKPSCLTCRFWEPQFDRDPAYTFRPGYCCRRAPVYREPSKYAMHPELTAVWPATTGGDFCGEHEPVVD